MMSLINLKPKGTRRKKHLGKTPPGSILQPTKRFRHTASGFTETQGEHPPGGRQSPQQRPVTLVTSASTASDTEPGTRQGLLN